VSPTGSDSNPGTQASPFATVQKANNSAAAGDTIWMRAGTYSSTRPDHAFEERNLGHQPHQDLGVFGEVPILDFSNYSLASSGSDNPAITVTGSWMPPRPWTRRHLPGRKLSNALFHGRTALFSRTAMTHSAGSLPLTLIMVHKRRPR